MTRTLDVRRMRVLREVAQRGTVAAAARALDFTPSAISQQLAALEREAGVALLDRHGGRVHLTEAGRADLAASASDVAGTVHVAAFPSAERALLAPALAALAARHPDVRVRTTELEPEASVPALRMGDVDLAISHEDVRRPVALGERLERIDLLEDPLYVVLPPGTPDEPVALAGLADATWVATPPGTACRGMLDEACRIAGFTAAVPYHANDFAVLAAFVAAGLGVALIPGLALGAFGDGVVVRAPSDVAVRRRIYVAGRSGTLSRPATMALIEALREAAAARS